MMPTSFTRTLIKTTTTAAFLSSYSHYLPNSSASCFVQAFSPLFFGTSRSKASNIFPFVNQEFTYVTSGQEIQNSFFFRNIVKNSKRNMSSESEGVSVKRVLVPIGEDSEEIETTCLTDTLVRFGADVTIASVMPDKENLVCKMSRGIKVVADVHISSVCEEDWDLIALPGGMPGAEYLRDSEELTTLLKKQKESGKLYAAVCASPAVVFAAHGLMDGTNGGNTCYPAPGFRAKLDDPSDSEVVVNGNVVTSQGPGTSLAFALKLGEILYGKEKADEIAAGMLVK